MAALSVVEGEEINGTEVCEGREDQSGTREQTIIVAVGKWKRLWLVLNGCHVTPEKNTFYLPHLCIVQGHSKYIIGDPPAFNFIPSSVLKIKPEI